MLVSVPSFFENIMVPVVLFQGLIYSKLCTQDINITVMHVHEWSVLLCSIPNCHLFIRNRGVVLRWFPYQVVSAHVVSNSRRFHPDRLFISIKSQTKSICHNFIIASRIDTVDQTLSFPLTMRKNPRFQLYAFIPLLDLSSIFVFLIANLCFNGYKLGLRLLCKTVSVAMSKQECFR